jgi:hypothetical protein
VNIDATTPRAVAKTDSASPPIADADSIGRDIGVPASVESDVVPKAAPLPSAPGVVKSVPPASSPSRRPTRWVRSFSRHWVVIRADASRHSRIVASVGPNSRVELGESRGSWRRIRAKGIAGWVEPRSSFEVVAAR